ncbi:hypothetical protein CROQUDRAFT_70356 [Cronartium quercuum f. sp. fusiforme G11]|uniref:Uncharacterized protein n=1 Tax=Cronartium quercuum f. sp. fusiforme G11 TaxID=708437 RepID=A0A9P6N7C5_9BASI|nr:hypothetical protein CROQUDRAFT_70356 [Cronartium quercuum f. sp. fusiforme G11]
MFTIWRPKARLLAPAGWLNDPMSIYQTKNGSWHIGYQCSPHRVVWGNVSQCSASTDDFTYFNDYHSWENPITIPPTQLYDIRGVFDGSIIKDGWNGYPTLIYTSASFGTLGYSSHPPEKEGTETQSIAYTEDDGLTWTKLNFGANGNPVIYYWPEQHLTGFRDPYVFESQEFLAFYSNSSIEHKLPNNPGGIAPTGSKFLTLSGGIRADADPLNAGGRLFLYRQTHENNVLDWTYLGALITLPGASKSSSPWRGSSGFNFECGALASINEGGRNVEGLDGSNPHLNRSHRLDVFLTGTEGGRNATYMDSWPTWYALKYDYNHPDGNVKAKVEFSGVIDWGRSYAYVTFSGPENRQVLVGWCYEDDEQNVLSAQRGYSGAFTLFRDIFVKVIRNVLPGSPDLDEPNPNWTVKTEPDGSKSVITFGQKIAKEVISAYKKSSNVFKPPDRTIDIGVDVSDSEALSTNIVGFESQPKDKFYAISAQLDFHGSKSNLNDSVALERAQMVRGGFRVLGSDHEWTDVYYDPSTESLVISRGHSSLISSYGNSTEAGKLRLWPICDPVTNITSLESLNMTIVVDNSILEVYANEQAVITTRVYPWLLNSTSVSFFVQASDSWNATGRRFKKADDQQMLITNSTFLPHSVSFSHVELWDGLVNSWPNRPRDTSLPGTFSHNITSTLYDLWPDV